MVTTNANTNFNVDLEWDIKYSTWLKLEESNQNQSLKSKEPELSVPILEEEEIHQIRQLAQSLADKGYEFTLKLEPRDSYYSYQVVKQYSDGPYRISVGNKFMSPLELESYENFAQVVQACKKNKQGLHARYNPNNMLIYKSEDKYWLGFRCHKCNGFKSSFSNPSKPFDIDTVIIHDYMEIPSPYYVNTDIFCWDCKKTGLSCEETEYLYEIEQALTYKVNEKSLALEYSSGGSVSIITTIGHIYKIK